MPRRKSWFDTSHFDKFMYELIDRERQEEEAKIIESWGKEGMSESTVDTCKHPSEIELCKVKAELEKANKELEQMRIEKDLLHVRDRERDRELIELEVDKTRSRHFICYKCGAKYYFDLFPAQL